MSGACQVRVRWCMLGSACWVVHVRCDDALNGLVDVCLLALNCAHHQQTIRSTSGKLRHDVVSHGVILEPRTLVCLVGSFLAYMPLSWPSWLLISCCTS